MNFLKTAVVSAALCFALASNMGASHAQETQRVLVVPVDAKGPALSKTAKQLTKALGDAAGRAGASVETGSVSRFAVTELVDCGDEAPACMQEMLDAVSVDVIVLGNILATEDGWIFVLKQVRRGEADKVETHILQPADAAALEAQIVDIANKTFGVTAAAVVEPPPVVDPVPVPVPVPTPTPPSSSSSFSLSNVDNTRWAILGAGAAVTVVGGIVMAVASGKQSGLDDAPDMTREEIDRLLDKEKTAERYQLIGNSLLIAGGVTLAVGATLAILQARSSEPTETPAMVIAPSPTRGGAMVTLTLFQ
jgi:hypothetical protein